MRPHITTITIASILLGLFAACDPVPSSVGPPDDPAATTSAPDETPTQTSDEAVDPLLVGLVVHVEGWDDDVLIDRHVTALESLAAVAEAHDATVTFEFGGTFMDAAESSEEAQTWMSGLDERGHAVGVHADISDPDDLDQLAALRQQAESLAGVAVTGVSGICSTGDWVEAARSAGYTSVDGQVEYCLKSLDALPEMYDAERIGSCSNPSRCHTVAPYDIEHRAHPWLTTSSSTWLEADPGEGAVVMIPEVGGLAWLAEDEGREPGTTGGERTFDADEQDVERAEELIDTYLAEREPGTTTAIVFNLSIGSVPSEEFYEAFFSMVDEYVAAGDAAWASAADIAEAARLHNDDLTFPAETYGGLPFTEMMIRSATSCGSAHVRPGAPAPCRASRTSSLHGERPSMAAHPTLTS